MLQNIRLKEILSFGKTYLLPKINHHCHKLWQMAKLSIPIQGIELPKGLPNLFLCWFLYIKKIMLRCCYETKM